MIEAITPTYRPKINVHKINESFLLVDTEDGVARELSEHFTFQVPNFRYMPKYRAGVWDGKIKLFSHIERKLGYGLLYRLVEFATKNHCDVIPHFSVPRKKVSREEVELFVSEELLPVSRGKRIVPWDFQIDAIWECIKERRLLLLSPTSSGKSFVIYSLVRWMIEKESLEDKILIIVPTTQLVDQIATDFADYSTEEGWDADKNIHRIYEGQSKITDKQIVVSTWQSIHRLPKQWFSQFGMIIIDEAHLATGSSMTSIMNKAETTPLRFALTGTLNGTKVHGLQVEAMFGRTHTVTTTREMIDLGVSSDIEINPLILGYDEETRKEFWQLIEAPSNKPKGALKYNREIDFITGNQRRNNFIVKLASSLSGNTLILFNYVDKHGIPLYETFREKYAKMRSHRKPYIVHGGVDREDRNTIKAIAEYEDGIDIVASFGTFSTGINIKSLRNLIIASPTKSQIRLLQSLGRMLRRTNTKNFVTVFDIVDDIRYEGKINSGMIHYFARSKIYKEQTFNVRTYKVPLVRPRKES